MRLLLDTNVLVFYIQDGATKRFLEEVYQPFSTDNKAIISIVSVGEIFSMAGQLGWGDKKVKVIKQLLDSLVIVEIRYLDLIEAYAEIDGYSQGRNPKRPLNQSARNMGKNDIWIAATAFTSKAKLLTSDHDFEHLDGEYFDVLFYEKKKNDWAGAK